MVQISQKLGQNIKRIRLKKRMSQGDILPSDWYGQKLYECDWKRQENVTLVVLEKLANALDVLVDELLK